MPPRRTVRVGALGRRGGGNGGRVGGRIGGRVGGRVGGRRNVREEDRASGHGEAEVDQQENVGAGAGPDVGVGANVYHIRNPVARDVVEALAAANLLHAPPVQASGNQRALEAMREFRRGNPPTFSGVSGDFLEADHWLSDVKQLFDALFITEDDLRVRIVACQLTGEASKWWQSILAARKDARRAARLANGTNEPDVEDMTWEEFEAIFENQYFPQSYRDMLRNQFERLEQGDMTVSNYAIQFQSLSRFAPELVASEERKCRRFENGLRLSIKKLVVSQRIKRFYEVVECARTVESIEEEEPAKAKVWEPRRQATSATTESEATGGSGRKRPRESGQAPQGQQSSGQSNTWNAPGFKQQLVCHKCGMPGHFRAQCTGNQTTTTPTPRKCYTCGKPGHIARDCQAGARNESGSVRQLVAGQGFEQQQVVNPGQAYYRQATSTQGSHMERGVSSSTPTQSVGQGGGQASGRLTQGRVYNIMTAANLSTTPETPSARGIFLDLVLLYFFSFCLA